MKKFSYLICLLVSLTLGENSYSALSKKSPPSIFPSSFIILKAYETHLTSQIPPERLEGLDECQRDISLLAKTDIPSTLFVINSILKSPATLENKLCSIRLLIKNQLFFAHNPHAVEFFFSNFSSSEVNALNSVTEEIWQLHNPKWDDLSVKMKSHLKDILLGHLTWKAPKESGAGATGAQFYYSADGKPLLVAKRNIPKIKWYHHVFQRGLVENFGDRVRGGFVYANANEEASYQILVTGGLEHLAPEAAFIQIPYSLQQEKVAFIEFLTGFSPLSKLKSSDKKRFFTYTEENLELTTELSLAALILGHVDLHEDNLMVKMAADGSIQVKIIDFGLTLPKSNIKLKHKVPAFLTARSRRSKVHVHTVSRVHEKLSQSSPRLSRVIHMHHGAINCDFTPVVVDTAAPPSPSSERALFGRIAGLGSIPVDLDQTPETAAAVPTLDELLSPLTKDDSK